MAEKQQQFRFLILLICLVSFILFLPVLYDNNVMLFLVHILYGAMLLITIYVLAENKKLLFFGVLLALPNFIILCFGLSNSSNTIITNIRLLSSLSVDIFVIVFLLYKIFQTRVVTINVIYAAICVYLLLGVTWGVIYTLIEYNSPGSFHGIHGIHAMAELSVIDDIVLYYTVDFLYYSFITLTTLGYGNIYPLTNLGNAFASVEAITGSLFIAILIGRLLGMHIAQSRE